ncbi:HU family DNA-binding protein [uncultured Tateyamaria sp.]|uniref:HU family DNA-binding protein n=1 Tax=uncultured Tateyamaria sp. TaxID=455651 RepID=UPI00262370BC|nr:HU family DNA-binding protein [uncultured Tateyamaria sp.]
MATRTTKTTPKTTTTRSTATKSKSTTKATTPAKSTATPAPVKSAAPVVVDAPTPVVAGPMMRKKELVDAAVARSGLKKKDVKPAIEAALAVMGEALQDGRKLNLPPFGKVKINREKKLASGRMLVARIRQNDGTAKPADDQGPDTGSSADTAPGTDKTAAE